MINYEKITIPNIPLNKWLNIMIICQNSNLDIYINGTITKSITLVGVPKQNYGDVYIAMNNHGFDGFISDLWYYNYALGIMAIQDLVKKGPNTKMANDSGLNIKDPNYLSLQWYFDNNIPSVPSSSST